MKTVELLLFYCQEIHVKTLINNINSITLIITLITFIIYKY